MNREKSRQIIRQAMEVSKSDNLERANRAFGHLTSAQLQREYGQSGETHQQVWDGYKKQRKEWEEAMAYLEEVL